MTTTGRIALSFPCGVLLAVVTMLAAARLDDPFWSPVLAWPVALVGLLHNAVMGPGPLLGHDQRGGPIYEGTPVLFFVFLLGILFSVLVYWGLSFLALWLLTRRKPSALR